MKQLIGINHKTAPIAIRERFFLSPTERDLLLTELKAESLIHEALVLCTCNRTEVYFTHTHRDVNGVFIMRKIARIKGQEYREDFDQYFYRMHDEEAVDHLFRVSAGLDSIVLGEKQILGQVKVAIDRARVKEMLSTRFNILSNMAIRAGKKAHTETDISFGGSSVSGATIAMSESMLGSLEGKQVLIIGAGKMGTIAMEKISRKGLDKIYLMNRTGSKAQNVVDQFGGIPVDFCDIKEVLTDVDLCIVSAGAPHYILDKSVLEKVMPKRLSKELLLFDISMPRNINPDVQDVKGVTLCSIDNLDKLVNENMKRRQSAVVEVESIIQDKIEEYYRKMAKALEFDSAFDSGSVTLR